MPEPAWQELEPLLAVADYRKGDLLVGQGDQEMEQFFILDGMLKRVVANSEGHEMILRFAAESDMDTSYAAWRRDAPGPAAARPGRRGSGDHDAGGRTPHARRQ